MTDQLQIFFCCPCDMEPHPPDPEPEVPVELEPGMCPVHARVCEYGCEMECFLDDLTEKELAEFDIRALQFVPEPIRREGL